MIDTVKNFAVDWDDWASGRCFSGKELGDWVKAIEKLAKLADPSGELLQELKDENIL